MPNQASAPTTLANEAGFYSKLGGNPSTANLYFRGESDGYEYQLTSADQTNNATFGTYTNYQVGPPNLFGGWTFLPGGLLLQYGKAVSVGQVTTVTFPKAFSDIAYSVTIARTQTQTSNTNYGVSNLTDKTFLFNSDSTSTGIALQWMAIGKA